MKHTLQARSARLILMSLTALVLVTGLVSQSQAVDRGYLPRDAYEAPPYVPPPPPEPTVHLTDNGNGTLSAEDGLMWVQKDSYSDLGHCLNWHESKDYVKKLNDKQFGGYTDWRMPTLLELVSIYDSAREVNIGHAGDPEYTLRTHPLFARGAAYWYWTSEAERTRLTDCCARSFYFVTGMSFVRRFTMCMNGGVRAVRGQATVTN